MITGLLIYLSIIGTIFLIKSCFDSVIKIAKFNKLFGNTDDYEIPNEVLHLYI